MTDPRRRRRRRGLLASALAGLALGALSPAAAAHAVVVSSSPSAGARLSSPPAVVEARFSEPVDRHFSKLTLRTAAGQPIAVSQITAASTQLAFKPSHQLGRGVYRVLWHSVSADDGHTVDGAYLFSVGTSLTGAARRAPRLDSADGGWSTLLLRSAFDATLILFCGAIFCGAALSPRGIPGGWLHAVSRPDRDVARLWRLTVGLGIGAAVLSVVVSLHDAARAADGLSAQSLFGYLTADLAGGARVAVTVALSLAVFMAAREATVPASALALVALLALAVGSHARAAHPAALAITTDAVHLAAGAVWIGGIAQLALAWLPGLRTLNVRDRRAALAVVLPSFGRLALPAFALVVVAGAATAATELPSPSVLWTDSYGRALVLKASLVVAIAWLSHAHAFRVRPRIITFSSYGSSLERRHWRLLAAEPPLAAGVLIAAAWLVVSAPTALSATALRATGRKTATEYLSIAGQAGPYIIDAVISERPRNVAVKLRTLDVLEHPVATITHVSGSTRQRSCGVGCIQTTLSQPAPMLTVGLSARGRTYRTSLPIQFRSGSARLAGRVLSEVARSSHDLRSVAIRETLSSGHGPVEVTDYRIQAPNRFAYRLTRAGRKITETTIVGTRQWSREAGQRTWTAGRNGGGEAQFSTRTYLNWWTPYTAHPRLLDIVTTGSAQQAEIATASEVSGLGTVWLQLLIDIEHHRVLRIRMITAAHFMTQTWRGFNARTRVQPPASSLDAGRRYAQLG